MIIPDSIKSLNQTSLLNSKEVAGLLGITVNALDKRLAKNSFSKADVSISRILSGANRKPSRYWYVKTVINHINGIG
jgi:hypothetical protein